MPAWAKSDRRSNNVRNAEGDLRKKSKNKDRRGSKSKPSDVENLNGSTLERDIDQEDIFEREETLQMKKQSSQEKEEQDDEADLSVDSVISEA